MLRLIKRYLIGLLTKEAFSNDATKISNENEPIRQEGDEKCK